MAGSDRVSALPVVGERSPEKAGVGGSIPSLATTFSTIYRHSKTQFHSISFQNNLVRRDLPSLEWATWSTVLGRATLWSCPFNPWPHGWVVAGDCNAPNILVIPFRLALAATG